MVWAGHPWIPRQVFHRVYSRQKWDPKQRTCGWFPRFSFTAFRLGLTELASQNGAAGGAKLSVYILESTRPIGGAGQSARGAVRLRIPRRTGDHVGDRRHLTSRAQRSPTNQAHSSTKITTPTYPARQTGVDRAGGDGRRHTLAAPFPLSRPPSVVCSPHFELPGPGGARLQQSQGLVISHMLEYRSRVA